MKKIAKRKKKKLIQAVKVPLTLTVKDDSGRLVTIPNNDPYAGKTKFIKHKPTVTGSGKF